MKRIRLSLGLAVLAGLTVPLAAPAALAAPFSGTEYQWRVHRVSAAYKTYGRWVTCAQGGGGADISCSHSIAVGNTVSGQVGVSDGVLSASVGFSVTKTTTLTGGASYHVPRHRVWQVQYQPVFWTKAVHQRLYKQYWACVPRGACGPVSKWIATNRYETAYASNFAFANFRHVAVR
jgi:hypothetical protein